MTTAEEIAELLEASEPSGIECDPLILRLLECHGRYSLGRFSYKEHAEGWAIYWDGKALPWALNLRLGFASDEIRHYRTLLQAVEIAESPRLVEILEELF